MFLDILDMLFDSVENVISAFNVDLFSVGSISVSFWELILGLLTLSILFGFFLQPRYGSVLGSIGSLEANRSRAEARASAEQAKADASSYDSYVSRRARNEAYASRYRTDMRKVSSASKKKG